MRQQKKAEKRAARLAAKQAKSGGWEDIDEDEEQGMAVDGAEGEGAEGDDQVEVVYDDGSDSDDLVTDSDDDDDLPSGTNVTYGDTEYELVLPSGARVGHRAHRTIYKQNLLPYVDGTPFKQPPHASQAEIKPSAQSQALLSLVPAMKKDRTHARPLFSAALVPAKGAGFGKGNGNTGEVIKARNKGEAKEASKATRHFHEHKRFQDQAFIRGLRGNSQKYVRRLILSLPALFSVVVVVLLDEQSADFAPPPPPPTVPRPAPAVDALAAIVALVVVLGAPCTPLAPLCNDVSFLCLLPSELSTSRIGLRCSSRTESARPTA